MKTGIKTILLSTALVSVGVLALAQDQKEVRKAIIKTVEINNGDTIVSEKVLEGDDAIKQLGEMDIDVKVDGKVVKIRKDDGTTETYNLDELKAKGAKVMFFDTENEDQIGDSVVKHHMKKIIICDGDTTECLKKMHWDGKDGKQMIIKMDGKDGAQIWNEENLPKGSNIEVNEDIIDGKKVKTIKITSPIKGDKGNPKTEQRIVKTLGESKGERLFNVFPNPNNGNVTISLLVKEVSDVVITITDVAGKTIMEEKISNFEGNYKKEFDLSSQPNGMYMATAIYAGNKSVLQFMKK